MFAVLSSTCIGAMKFAFTISKAGGDMVSIIAFPGDDVGIALYRVKLPSMGR